MSGESNNFQRKIQFTPRPRNHGWRNRNGEGRLRQFCHHTILFLPGFHEVRFRCGLDINPEYPRIEIRALTTSINAQSAAMPVHA